MGGDCLNNIPYASVVGCIFCIVGAGVMGGTMWEALRLADERIISSVFQIRFEWMLYVRIAVVSLCGFVTLIAMLLIVFGYLATKATRQHLYHEEVCTMGGRCTACCCLGITYLLSIVWVLLFAILALPVVCWLMMASICRYERLNANYTFNLKNYGIYDEMLPNNAVSSVSGVKFVSFCESSEYIGPLFGAAFAGTLMVVFGLCSLAAAISSLGMRLKYTKELNALKQGCDDEQTDELQSFLVQNARAGFNTNSYQLQPVTSSPLQAADQSQYEAYTAGAGTVTSRNQQVAYAESARDARLANVTAAGQYDRLKAASPSAQFDARGTSKSGTLQFDQRSIQQQSQTQSQYDQRTMPQYDARSQQQYSAGYAQPTGAGNQSGSASQLTAQMTPTGHHQTAMANATPGAQVGLVNMTNYYASMNRATSNGGRADGGTLPTYGASMHAGYMAASANMQLGLHDVNAYQLGSNDMNAVGASIDEEEADAEWNMQMNTNVLKQ